MKNKFILSENEIGRIKSLHKKFGYQSGLLNEAEYLNQDRPGDPFSYLKVDDGTTTKYYFKGIRDPYKTKYPNWVEAVGSNLNKIKSDVKFKTTAETTSQMSSSTTTKTDEELYTEYFNNEFKKIKPETLPKGKVTKLTDGTYGYVLDDGSYTLLSDGYSINKDGVKSTNKWTETAFVKPQQSATASTQTDLTTLITDFGTKLKDSIIKLVPGITITDDVVKKITELLKNIDQSTITKITEFITKGTGTITDLLALIPEDIKKKLLELLPTLSQSTTQQTTIQSAGQRATF